MRHVPFILTLLMCAACGGDGDAAALEGTYLLDRDQLAQDLLQERIDRLTTREQAALSDTLRREWLADVRATAAETDIRLDVLSGGKFVIRYRYGEEEGRRGGLWRRAGTRVVLRTTETAAGPLDDPTEITGTYTQGALRFFVADTLPHAFTLRRR